MTPSLLLFFTLCAVLTVLLAVVVIVPWLKAGKVSDNQLMALNVQVFHERIKELTADKDAGVIDQKTFSVQETELKRQLLNAQTHQESHAPVGRKSRLIIMVWIPILVALVYLLVADRTSVFKLWTAQDTVGQVADDLLTGKIDTPPKWATVDSTALITAMQTNVHHHAHDPNRWMRLSELFVALEATPQSLEALARAYRLDPTNDEIAMTYAQTSFFANNGTLDNTTRNVLSEILKNTPDHEGAMMMMAMGDVKAGEYTRAKAWVSKLRTLVAGKSGDRSQALASLDELLVNINAQEQKAQNAAKTGVDVHVTIDSQLLADVSETDTVFVSISGSAGGPPYAVKRLSVSEIKNAQFSTKLSDLDAMMPERTLSAGRESGTSLMVNARISKSGNAVSQSGDLSATPTLLGKDQQTVQLTIAQKVP